ncbi:hypothetical protein A0H81_02801 [Grifola frondosa]|uniref:Uncharacterized protein n=1 Tax=Grifola frondosa TaxID=5627 RepID=A0A1C7MNM9_GRIFR|nr:hypothetical protein A0H81_02801 [Grifola frondosa]
MVATPPTVPEKVFVAREFARLPWPKANSALSSGECLDVPRRTGKCYETCPGRQTASDDVVDPFQREILHNMHDFEDHRWSELIPPHTALTFAAMWDPVDGMVTFSGAHLLDTDDLEQCPSHNLADSPHDVPDSQSQILTIDRIAYALYGTTPNSATFACDAQGDAGTAMDSDQLGTPSPALASSAALVSDSELHQLFTSCINRTRFMRLSRPPHPAVRACTNYVADDIEAYTNSHESEDTVKDEGFCEGRRLTSCTYTTAPVIVDLNLSSAFSVTTTSTSRYIEVDYPSTIADNGPENALNEDEWSTLADADRAFCFNIPLERRRRLRKPRTPSRSSTGSLPADPAEVLAREQYNHASSTSSERSPRRSATLTKAILQRLAKGRKHVDDERWVCIEVKHKSRTVVFSICCVRYILVIRRNVFTPSSFGDL